MSAGWKEDIAYPVQVLEYRTIWRRRPGRLL